MKAVKIILKILIGVLLGVLLLLVVDYVRLNLSYLFHKKDYKESFAVYGNQGNYVPQGFTYSEEDHIVLQTSYNSNHTVSMLYVIDFQSGNLLKELKLKELDDSDNVHHVGGITTDGEKVWITNDYEINEYLLEDILTTENDYIQSVRNEKLPNRGDFCTYHDGTLWIGDFYLDPWYPVPDHTPLLMAYSFEKEVDYFSPELVISLPKMVQGMAITEDQKFLFTTSFTNLIHSQLLVYDNVLKEEEDTYSLKGKKIPYYHLNQHNLLKQIQLPPMAEEFFLKDEEIYMLFENSSDTYFYAYPKMKNIIRMDLSKIDS